MVRFPLTDLHVTILDQSPVLPETEDGAARWGAVSAGEQDQVVVVVAVNIT